MKISLKGLFLALAVVAAATTLTALYLAVKLTSAQQQQANILLKLPHFEVDRQSGGGGLVIKQASNGGTSIVPPPPPFFVQPPQ